MAKQSKMRSVLEQVDPQAAYQDLFDKLDEAYWVASDVAGKDQIQGAKDAVYKILTAINKAKLEEDTTALSAIAGFVTQTNTALGKLKNDITNIIKKIQLAADIENALAKVIALGGKLAA